MDTQINIERILFYGDSLVFGKVSGANERLNARLRFTGVVQDKLGDGYEVIENGLRGRTLVGENYFFKERDGLKQFGTAVGTQLPLSSVVIILGTNDANSKASTKPGDVASALDDYITKLRDWVDFLEVEMPEVYLTIPPNISEEDYDEGAQNIFGSGAPEKLKKIQEAIEQWATRNSKRIIDLRRIKPGNGDGIHLDETGNREAADLISIHLIS